MEYFKFIKLSVEENVLILFILNRAFNLYNWFVHKRFKEAVRKNWNETAGGESGTTLLQQTKTFCALYKITFYLN